ncbi:MAG: hypothetical protein DCC71_08995 [Proteobacteria bacterium]|nr:MAG: hypothetical protein DCC71_08995 [Pseudomonadota bacterium]
MHRGARGSRIAWLLCAAAALALPAAGRAQNVPADCGCSLTGPYVDPDPGVGLRAPNAATGLSPGGRYRVVVTSLPGQSPATLDVVRVSDGATLLQGAGGVQWGFSPDDDRFVIGSFVGAPPGQQFEYALHDLASATPQTPIWSNGPTPWSSARLRFSEDGSVFLFAGHQPTLGTSLAIIEVASRSLFQTGFLPSTAPGDLDADEDPAVEGWGFGPNPARFVYAYVSNAGVGTTEWGRVNVATRIVREETFTANTMHAVFSPCGDAVAFVVKQLATSDLTDVYLHATADPLAAPLGSLQMPVPALQVQSTAAQHEVLQGGESSRLADNRADEACAAANDPPVAEFDVTPLVAGSAGGFTDTSSDSDGQVVAWQWDFGDGATSAAQHPSHTYATSGTFRVRLTVTDDGGATDATERDVSVCASLASLGGRVLFEENRDLFVLNAADGSRVRLTNGDVDTYSEARDGRFSPDGARIAYADTGIFLAGIWVMDADGSHRRRLTDGSGPTGDFDFHEQPAWSPDGAWIAFRSDDVVTPADQGLWMVRPDGTSPTKIASTSWFDFAPDFAPDVSPGCAGLSPAQRGPGCYTIFFARAANPGPGSFLVRAQGDGSTATPLTPVGSYGNPRVSPDGARLAYSRSFGFGGPVGGITRVVTRLLATGAEQTITEGGDEIFTDPVWSPDGQAIAYAYSAGAVPGSTTNYEMGVSDGAGCSERALLSAPGHQQPQDWAPGHAVQGPGSIAGRAVLATNARSGVAGALVSISGDVSGTTTTDANGDFVFENLPVGANVTIRFVSAPGYVEFQIPPWSATGVVGHAVGALVRATPAQSTVRGTIRTDTGEWLPGVTLTASGANGPIVAQTDANGDYVLSALATYQSYTLTPSLAGYRFEPPSVTFTAFGSFASFPFTATPLPPAGRIAFVRSSEDGDDEIFVADLDGANAANLTSHPAHDRDPAWSPDGTRIAFASDRDGFFALFVMDAEGDVVTPLDVAGREPAWSPDGTHIVFASDGGLGRLRLADGAISGLTSDPSDASPRFRTDQPDWVTFERSVGPDDSDVYVATLHGDVFGFAEVNTIFAEVDPAWAATGSRLAYASVLGSQPGVTAIWMRDFDSGAWHGFGPGANPTWSPDGAWIAYDDAGAIRYVRADEPFALPRTAVDSGSDRDPDWQPAGGGACANGVDDDGDGLVDGDDPGCTGPSDASERAATPGCDDGADDDGDGLVDLDDPGCAVGVQPYEDPPCDNGIDDDGDGLVDGDDPVCEAHWPYWETEPRCGLGAELALVLAALARRRVR